MSITKHHRTFLTTGILSISLPLLTSTVSAADCGDVTIADMNWSSASLIANVDQFILSEGYGCNAELIPGDTMPTGTSMLEKGEPDIAPELWANSMLKPLEQGVKEKRLRFAGKSLSDGGEEGFWLPKYLVDQYPSLATIEGVLKRPDLFEHPEDDELAAFYNCPPGWNCEISAANLFTALDMENHGFELVNSGSGAGLSGSIAKAYERKKGWLGYYWAPTAVLGKYEMVKVDFGTGVNEQHYKQCITQEGCANPKPTMYPPALVVSVTTERFASQEAAAYQYITKRAFTNQTMNKLLAWMEDNQAEGSIAAEHFLTNYESIWREWVSADAAEKIKAAL
ncbi:ABC transporter substrate-binding protein [Marinomonas agarivorans]|nr:ABC transporter substrate-binding protein [Marinomonas agarivorans]